MVTFDSNVLIYAMDAGDHRRSGVAGSLLLGAGFVDSFITQQAIGEFCNVVFRKRLLSAARIRTEVDLWAAVYHFIPTSPQQLLAAAGLAERRQKQFWDMVIVRVAADAGATVLFTEDIGDGEVIEGVRIINPFAPANFAEVAALLAA